MKAKPGRKPKVKEVKPAVHIAVAPELDTATLVPSGFTFVEKANSIVSLLTGSYDFGREDLNTAFKLLEDKINEVIKHL